jgi:hypothetical protein
MWEWMYRSTFSCPRHCPEVSDQLHAPALPWGKSPLYPLNRTLGGPQSQSGRYVEVNIFLPERDSNSDPSVIQPVASRCSDCSIPARKH